MIMSPDRILMFRNAVMSLIDQGITESESEDDFNKIDNALSHLEDCLMSIVSEITSIDFLNNGFVVTFHDMYDDNFDTCEVKTDFILGADKFTACPVDDHEHYGAHSTLICAYLNYLSGFDA